LNVFKIETKILSVLFRRRRLLAPHALCADCFAPHLDEVRQFVAAAAPIELVLPAFPAKSPSPKKTLGTLPDLAEELALDHLQHLCDEIEDVYPRGARLHICSDGRVFADLVGVSDEAVRAYGRALETHLGPSLSTFSLDDLGELELEPLSLIEAHTSPALFNGIQRFLFEDRVALEPRKSRSQVRRECRDLAYRVIQRSEAWGRLVAKYFPHALRLSIHPQPPHAAKIGVQLTDDDAGWLTPWHAVAVKEGDHFRLMHRDAAEALGAHLVQRDGRPSHFEVSP
jgi:pyoverdine/dityrosine biosynthesis protein Dit1